MSRLATRLISLVALASVAYAVYRVAGDVRPDSFSLQRPWLLGVLLSLGALNHALRWARWHILLRAAALRPVRPVHTAHSFLMGSLAIFTPARVGELLKGAVALRLAAVPLGSTFAVLAMERSLDLAIMAVLLLPGYQSVADGGIGDAMIGGMVAAGALAVVGIAALPWIVGRLPRRLAGLVGTREDAAGALRRLTSRRVVASGALIGAGAWVAEAFIYAMALVAAGADWSGELLATACTIWAAASLAGALSLLPAGLGVTEGSLIALAVSLGRFDFSIAATAAIIARGAVLGTIVVSGLPSLWVWSRQKEIAV